VGSSPTPGTSGKLSDLVIPNKFQTDRLALRILNGCDVKTKLVQRRKRLKSRTWEYPKGGGSNIAEMPNKTGGYQVRIPGVIVRSDGRAKNVSTHHAGGS